MTLDYAESERVTGLRNELRQLLDEHVPPDFLGAFTDDPADFETAQRFCRELGRRQLLTMAWPTEFGGTGADVWEQTALREEMWAAHEPRGAQYMGLNWVGPSIMRHGTADQRQRHLPPIAAGDVVWCQGFSEPEAGSDLPALATRATPADGGWRITGQKVWTSYARMAQWCFLLARTGTRQARKEGITVFLVEMGQPGIEVRPIEAMLGPHHLNEVYLDQVWVPDRDRLGEVDGGWQIVADVLGLERIGIARYARCDKLLRAAPQAMGSAAWAALPEALRQRWAGALVKTRQARLLAYRLLAGSRANVLPTQDAALYRIAVTTLDQEVGEVLMQIVGNRALGTRDGEIFARQVEDHWRYAQASTVASGTLEINKNAYARKLVGR